MPDPNPKKLDGYDTDGLFDLLIRQEHEKFYRAHDRVPMEVKPRTPLSVRVAGEIDRLEVRGKKARRESFIVIPQIERTYRGMFVKAPIIRPDNNIFQKIGNRTFYRLYGLHYFSGLKGDPATCGIQTAIDHAHSKVYVMDGGTSSISPTPYPLGASIVVGKPNLALEGESYGTVLTPTADVDLIQYSPGANSIAGEFGQTGMLYNNQLRTFFFDDPNSKQSTTGALRFKYNAGGSNGPVILNCEFRQLQFAAVWNGITTDIPNNANQNMQKSIFSDCFFGLRSLAAGREPRHSALAIQNWADVWLFNFVMNAHAPASPDANGYFQIGTGSQISFAGGMHYDNWLLDSDTLGAPLLVLNNTAGNWFTRARVEIGAPNGNDVGLKILGTSGGDLYFWHYSNFTTNIGVWFTSGIPAQHLFSTVFVIPNIKSAVTAFKIDSGSGVSGLVLGGLLDSNTTVLSNPGNSTFIFRSVSGYLVPASVIATPFDNSAFTIGPRGSAALPTSLANDYLVVDTDLNMVDAAPNGGTVTVKDNLGTQLAAGYNSSTIPLRVPALSKVRFVTALPTTFPVMSE